jgi:gliding motility-associated-like protein
MNTNLYVKKFFFLLLIFFLAQQAAMATHNRAGEITYRCLGALTYEITATTYTDTDSPIDRLTLDVYFGDGLMGSFPRINGGGNGEILPNGVKYNVYRQTHAYYGSGIYDIYFVDPNRNQGVVNIPNSVLTEFAVHAFLIINPNYACNNSVELLNRPIDRGCAGVPFLHDPAAYDPDGDSLSFELVACRGANNQPIPGYTFPLAPNSFTLDAHTGLLLWDYPPSTGIYTPEYEVNVAFEIKEWRYSSSGTPVLMGVVERDMQITISSCNNHPPQIQSITDTCALANSSVSFTVTATDPENDLISLSASGGPLNQVVLPQAQFSTVPSTAYTNDTVVGTFSWSPSCAHVRQQPYQVSFKAEDSSAATDFVNLVDFESFFIRVIAPAPTNLSVTPSGNTMFLQWNKEVCSQATGYKIYHRIGSYPGTIQCPCETGVPAYTGYTLIGQTSGINDTTFIDSNNGQGLTLGVLHCYLVVAKFADGSESCASNPACAQLKKELPVITNVSVDATSTSAGSMYVAWSKPNELDTVQYPGPYQYKVYHSASFHGTAATPVATYTSLDDTIYYDLGLNTDFNPYSYYVELYYDSAGIPTLKGKSSNASSIFLTLTPTDQKVILNWEEYVPWGNYRYVVYRFNGISFDSIAQVSSIPNIISHTYTDSSLVNGLQYCYKIKSVGTYSTPGILDTLINFSQEECAVPIDNIPPCPPQLTVLADCIAESNFLSWTNPNLSCSDDVIKYYIYYSADSVTFEIINTTFGDTSITFNHSDLSSVSGCYKVTAIDSAGNESQALAVCVDTCRQYVLPSVFTPNGDGLNDLFHPCDSSTAEPLQKTNCPPYKNVIAVEIKIFDRWGLLMYETSDKNVNWNGKNQESKKDCPEGVYYYTCIVHFARINGTESMNLNGYVHLMRGK